LVDRVLSMSKKTSLRKTAICGASKTCETMQNDRYPVLEGIKVGDQAISTFSNCAMGHSSNRILEKLANQFAPT